MRRRFKTSVFWLECLFHDTRFVMEYFELLRQSVESFSNGGISLVDVPEDLRVSQSSVVSLSYDMQDAIRRNEQARQSSVRTASRMFLC